jgi:thiamine biosynthesis lipoprotein
VLLESQRVSALLGLGLENVDPWVHESVRVDGNSYRTWRARPAMGTVVSVVALHPSRAQAEDASEAAFGAMSRLIGILDRHDSTTPLAHLNAAGRLDDAPPELAEVIGAALRYHQLSSGAFDVTVQPLVDLLRSSHGQPAPADRECAAGLVGASRLRLDGRRIAFDREGMGVTLDGIAKGYIVDRMADVLARHGIRRFLINGGGDIRARGGKEDGRPWTIGVRDPEDPEGLCDVVSLSDGALATSGNYERPFPHIVDAGDGRASRASQSASVCAPDAMAADALATAVFALGGVAGCRLARSLPGCECLVVDEAGRSARSPGWRSEPAMAGEA